MTDQTINQDTWTPDALKAARPPSRFPAPFFLAMAAVAAGSFLVGLTQTVP